MILLHCQLHFRSSIFYKYAYLRLNSVLQKLWTEFHLIWFPFLAFRRRAQNSWCSSIYSRQISKLCYKSNYIIMLRYNPQSTITFNIRTQNNMDIMIMIFHHNIRSIPIKSNLHYFLSLSFISLSFITYFTIFDEVMALFFRTEKLVSVICPNG